MRPWAVGDYVTVFFGKHVVYSGAIVELKDALIFVYTASGTKCAMERQAVPAGLTAWTWRHLKHDLKSIPSRIASLMRRSGNR